MAGDWIKLQTCTPDKPEVYLLAEELDIDPDAVVGKLVRIWCWADAQTRDGYATVTKALLDRITGVTGFTVAMLHVGWLVETEHGFMFPNFERHNGKTAKTRAMGTVRVQNHRSKSSGDVTCNADVTQMKRDTSHSSVTKALPEKRREEKTLTVSSLTTTQTPERSTEPPFTLLSCNRSEWPVVGEVAVPASLEVFQSDVLLWARYLRDSDGPNFDQSALQDQLRFGAKLGRKFPASVEWSIKTRKDKLANPRHEPDDKIDFEAWHRIKLAFDAGGCVPAAIRDNVSEAACEAWVRLAKKTLKDSFSDSEARKSFAAEFLASTGTDLASKYFQTLREVINE